MQTEHKVIAAVFLVLACAGASTAGTMDLNVNVVAPIGSYVNDSVNLTANQTTVINATGANTTLELASSQNANGSINLVLTSTPVNIPSLSVPALNKYLKIETSNITTLAYVIIKSYYTDEEVTASGIEEGSLSFYWWNSSSSAWEKLSSAMNWVYGAGVNTTANFVWANVTHFSDYSIGGTLISTPPPGSPGGGGGGGGGGGASSENASNIIVKEKYDLHIFKDKTTSYRFTNSSNPVTFVNITGNVSAGEINVAVEVLRGTSTLVNISPPGNVYKNINIWVGTSGFAVPRNIKEAIINFSVENSWLSNNNFASGDVKLLRWDRSKWVVLETAKKIRNSTHTYYEAKTYYFSPFAITGLKEAAVVPTATPIEATVTPTIQANVTGKTPVATEEPGKTNDILLIIIVLTAIIITALSAAYVFKRRRG